MEQQRDESAITGYYDYLSDEQVEENETWGRFLPSLSFLCSRPSYSGVV
ncbi:MAG: hypothetical protein WAM71_12575 [Candidatus Korobacteraceae bacterium]